MSTDGQRIKELREQLIELCFHAENYTKVKQSRNLHQLTGSIKKTKALINKQ